MNRCAEIQSRRNSTRRAIDLPEFPQRWFSQSSHSYKEMWNVWRTKSVSYPLVFENGCFMSQTSQWVMSQWVNESVSQIWKNRNFGRNNKIKHYFYLICLLASLLPAHARPICDMKSQPGLFVSSIPGPAATTTCMPRKIAFRDCNVPIVLSTGSCVSGNSRIL